MMGILRFTGNGAARNGKIEQNRRGNTRTSSYLSGIEQCRITHFLLWLRCTVLDGGPMEIRNVSVKLTVVPAGTATE